MLTFDLVIKYIGLCHVHVRPLTFASIHIGIPYLAYHIWHMGVSP